MKRTVDEIKSIKILKARNGVALIAVLSILLILTLLLPVIFQLGTSSTESAIIVGKRQKVEYLARSGAEIALGTLESTLISNNTEWQMFYRVLKNSVGLTQKKPGDKSISDLGITHVDSTNTSSFNFDRIWFYQNPNVDPDSDNSGKYYCQETEPTDTGDYRKVGYVDVVVSISGNPLYYKYNEATGGYDNSTKALALNAAGEVKPGYYVVNNHAYKVEATAKIGSFVVRKTAQALETLEAGSEETQLIEYSGNTIDEMPEYARNMHFDMQNDYRIDASGKYQKYTEIEKLGIGTGKYEWKEINPKTVSSDNGGNVCYLNPAKANSKTEIAVDNPMYNIGNGYAKSYVYVYSTLGNMLVKCEGTGTAGQDLAIGVFPGIRWNEANNPYSNQLIGVNYNDYSDTVQNANFISLCATNVLNVDMGIDVRVNPARTGRMGDVKIFGEGNSNNASLFKMLHLQGKDIVIGGETHVMMSFFNPQNKNWYTTHQTNNTGKRMGTVVLSAPISTPYTYYNTDRGEYVKAGKVYFMKDVYLWLIEYNSEGSKRDVGSAIEEVFGAQTAYNSRVVTTGDFADSPNLTEKSIGDFKVVKLFSAGDVYYFNAEIRRENADNSHPNNEMSGMSFVNWYIETQYLKRSSLSDASSVRGFFKTLRENLYVSIVKSLSDADTYVPDDMHYIGNMNENSAITIPDVENSLYVVWAN